MGAKIWLLPEHLELFEAVVNDAERRLREVDKDTVAYNRVLKE